MDNPLPNRAPRVSASQQLEICRLDIRGLAQTEIAESVGVHRHTVGRVLERTRAAIAIDTELAPERERALAVYREIQRLSFEAAEEARKRGRSPAMLYAEVRQAQARIDTLLGLAPAEPDDPFAVLAQFKAVVVNLIAAEAPDLAPVLAERLRAANDEGRRLEVRP
jgi:hypothetical protein